MKSTDSISLAKRIRANVLHMVYKAKASHVGSCLSVADILAVLYGNTMTINVDNIMCHTRDRFILSKGHAAPALYSCLARSGYFPIKELKTLRKHAAKFLTLVEVLKMPIPCSK